MATGGCVHEWVLHEVLLETDAADTTSICMRCGTVGFLAGQGRTPRPELPEIEFTQTEQRHRGAPGPV